VQAYVENLEKEVRRLVDENLKLKKQCKEVHAKTYTENHACQKHALFSFGGQCDEHFFFFCCTAETGSSGTGPPNQELTSKNLIHPILKGQRNMNIYI
jgi:superoxide dismutase